MEAGLALAVSTLYIVLTCLIGYWLRRYCMYYVHENFVRSLILEGIATAELCGACFELIIGKQNYLQNSNSTRSIVVI